MELTEIIDGVRHLQSEEERLGDKAEQMRAERSRHCSEYYRQIDLLEKKEKEEEQQYNQEARQVESEQRKVELKKENYFNQLCALYSNGQRVEVKEFITGFGDKEFLKRLNLQECRDSLNELLKEKSSHVEVNWGGGLTDNITIGCVLNALIEGSKSSAILDVKRDLNGIPEITFYGEKVYLVSSIQVGTGFRYGFQEKITAPPNEYSQDIFRYDLSSAFGDKPIEKLHLFSDSSIKNEQLEWLGLLVKQAVLYQKNAEGIRAGLEDNDRDCCGD